MFYVVEVFLAKTMTLHAVKKKLCIVNFFKNVLKFKSITIGVSAYSKGKNNCQIKNKRLRLFQFWQLLNLFQNT